MKEIAPGTNLRKWFGHDPGRWEEFRRRYQTESRQYAREFDGYRRLRDAAASRWCSPRTMKHITTPSR
jgi:uncharacterized protein YeaO (DUF488 family)